MVVKSVETVWMKVFGTQSEQPISWPGIRCGSGPEMPSIMPLLCVLPVRFFSGLLSCRRVFSMNCFDCQLIEATGYPAVPGTTPRLNLYQPVVVTPVTCPDEFLVKDEAQPMYGTGRSLVTITTSEAGRFGIRTGVVGVKVVAVKLPGTLARGEVPLPITQSVRPPRPRNWLANWLGSVMPL